MLPILSEIGSYLGCLEQLVRVDIYGCDHVFGQREFVERFAHEPAQTHDCFTAKQNVESKLSLKFFKRRRCSVAHRELWAERFFQTPHHCFSREFRATVMRRSDRDQDGVLERWKIAALAKFELLIEVADKIVMPREPNRRRERRVSLHENFAQPFAATGTPRNLREQLKCSFARA